MVLDRRGYVGVPNLPPNISILQGFLSLHNITASLALFNCHHCNQILARRDLLQKSPEGIVTGLWSWVIIASNEDSREL